MFEKGWIAQARLDQSIATRDAARSAVKYARSRFNLARRNLANTVLKAPFDGFIAKRHVDPHMEVAAG